MGSKRKAQEKEKDSAAHRILSKPAKITNVSFAIHKSIRIQKAKRNKSKVARFPMNPERNWGPKSRATGNSNLQTHKKMKRGPSAM